MSGRYHTHKTKCIRAAALLSPDPGRHPLGVPTCPPTSVCPAQRRHKEEVCLSGVFSPHIAHEQVLNELQGDAEPAATMQHLMRSVATVAMAAAANGTLSTHTARHCSG
jgi:hypothetical protein